MAYEPMCLDQFGALAETPFLLRACTMCYFFLFPGYPLTPNRVTMESLVDIDGNGKFVGTLTKTLLHSYKQKIKGRSPETGQNKSLSGFLMFL